MPPQRRIALKQAAITTKLKSLKYVYIDIWYFMLIWYNGIAGEVVINKLMLLHLQTLQMPKHSLLIQTLNCLHHLRINAFEYLVKGVLQILMVHCKYLQLEIVRICYVIRYHDHIRQAPHSQMHCKIWYDTRKQNGCHANLVLFRNSFFSSNNFQICMQLLSWRL